ncbi:MAG: bifunctional diaminohydroxyphosphoribosylaminopyrimidine deaminase/5-amino-6-(5-phosphoribosylamino)uracil reductase, partial [Acidobacteria bacterium]
MPSRGHVDPRRGISVSSRWGWGPSASEKTLARDKHYMDRALLLAARGLGRTSPNPLVGAVVVSPDEIVVGQGFHRRAGEAHAEVYALDMAGARARGSTLYCTLEPCCHVGRTGPCVPRIVDAGVAR